MGNLYYKNNKHEFFRIIDSIKAISIISIIILHSLDSTIRLQFGVPFIFNQAVPFFILIASINRMYSYYRKDISFAKYKINYYQLNNICHYISKRLIIPYLLVFLLYILANYIYYGEYNYNYILFDFIGKIGYGGYFVFLFISIYLLFPLCLQIFKMFSLNVCLFVCLFVDTVFVLLPMPSIIYNILPFRYIAIVFIGIYVCESPYLKNKCVFSGLLLGVFYIFIDRYFIQIKWSGSHTLAYGYTLYVFMLISNFMKNHVKEKIIEFCGKIGKASYHILLVQIIYMNLTYKLVENSLFVKNFSEGWILIYVIFANIIICVVSGYLYYLLDMQLKKYINY